MKPEVTIGIPVYNVETYIRQSLESALAQTFESIEYLIIDDCGSDGSMTIIRELQASHPRGGAIRILSQARNSGVAAARNRIIDEASGRYLFFMDADDLLTETCIATLHKAMTDSGADAVFGSYDKIGTDGTIVEHFAYPQLSISGVDAFAAYAYQRLGTMQAGVWNTLLDLSFLRATGLKMIDAAFWEDFVFTFDLATFIRHAVLLPEVTYYYMCREGSLSHYQARAAISREEVMANARTIDHLKVTSAACKGKPYYRRRLLCIFKMDLYIVRDILRKWRKITPRITPRDLLYIMRPIVA